MPFYDRVGKRHGLMGFGRDITERKRYGRAGERQQEKTTFISTISHELRTPLNGIVGLSRILLDTELNDEQLKYLKTIHVSAITLGNIFNDIIEMDKLERRKVQLDNQPVDFTGFPRIWRTSPACWRSRKGCSSSWSRRRRCRSRS